MTPSEKIKKKVQHWHAWSSKWRHVNWEAVSPSGKHMTINKELTEKHKRLDKLVADITKIAKEAV
jgi:hypothetical protein